MRSSQNRWGEVTVKRQSTDKKPRFNKTKTFGIFVSGHNYTIEQFTEILKLATDLTERVDFKNLKKTFLAIKPKNGGKNGL